MYLINYNLLLVMYLLFSSWVGTPKAKDLWGSHVDPMEPYSSTDPEGLSRFIWHLFQVRFARRFGVQSYSYIDIWPCQILVSDLTCFRYDFELILTSLENQVQNIS